jgi:hypothetical protein
MEMNFDLLRHLLLKIEGSKEYLAKHDAKMEVKFEKLYPSDKYDVDYDYIVNYHHYLLYDAGFINAQVVKQGSDMSYYIPQHLTYNGALYLQNIKDDRVWNNVKIASKKVATLTIPIIQKIAEKAILGYIDL